MKKKFYPIAATCADCKDLMITCRMGHFVSCKCGASSIDAGDEYYWRAVGAIEKVWKLRPIKKGVHSSWKLLKFKQVEVPADDFVNGLQSVVDKINARNKKK